MSAAREAGALGGSPGIDALNEWVEQAQAGDQRAFERLYRMHVDAIYGLCLRMVGDPTRAEGLTQDAFVRAWQKLGSFRREGAFGGWLRRLAIRLVIEDRRKAVRSARWLADEIELETLAESGARGPAGASVPPARVVEILEMERAVAALPAGARMVFLLHDVEGYRHREIAAVAGSSVGTVKAQLHRARMLLRRALAERPEGAPS